jgi:hypothetical protein
MEYLLGSLEAKLLEKEETPSDELVFLINSRIKPPVQVEKDNVFIRAMFLISDQVNSYGGCFPSNEHQNLAELLIDSPVLVGHTKDKLPIARNFKAELVKKDDANWIKVWFYWLKESTGSLSLKGNIDHGIYKECSIGFSFEFPECSICGEDMRRCEHVPFKKYAGPAGDSTQAYFNYRKIHKVLETSLVYRGALPDTSLTNDLIYQKHKCQDGICKLGRVYKDVVEGALKKGGLDGQVKLVGGILEKGYSDHDIDLICSPDLQKKILISLPESYRRKIHFVEKSERNFNASLLNFIPPCKPEKSASVSNEIFHPEDFSLLSGDWIVEPKYDGIRAQVHKKGEEIKIFTDQGDAVESRFLNLTKAFGDFPHQNFILDGEIVKYKGKTRLTHREVTSYLHQKDKPWDDSNFRYKLFDVLYFCGADLTSEPLDRRKQVLKENFRDTDFVQIVQFERLCSDSIERKLKEFSTSEGTMIKRADSTYFDSSKWFKWKKELELDVLVTKVIRNKGRSYNYVCAVGSRSNPTLIGTTYSTNLECQIGDIIRVRIDHINKNNAGYSWYAPQVKDVRGDKKEPDPVSVVERMMRKANKDRRVDISDLKEKNRFALQIYWWSEARHHDLGFSKDNGATGLTIFKFDLDALNKGKRFLCEWKEYHDPKWLDFEGVIPPSKKDGECNLSKNVPAHIKILDSGDYEILERQPDSTSFKIDGKILKGIYLVRKVILNKNRKWLFWKKQ